ncbi:hypothetical protein EAF00_002404 [Botryotinia globosa]|nr:hypothetical protein EAF00_002404 [Botryotinia globosa]
MTSVLGLDPQFRDTYFLGHSIKPMSIQIKMLTSTSLAKNGSNKPTWLHKPSLFACVSLDKTDVSAYSNQNCNPGANGEDDLGDIGEGCAELDIHFTAGRIGRNY